MSEINLTYRPLKQRIDVRGNIFRCVGCFKKPRAARAGIVRGLDSEPKRATASTRLRSFRRGGARAACPLAGARAGLPGGAVAPYAVARPPGPLRPGRRSSTLALRFGFLPSLPGPLPALTRARIGAVCSAPSSPLHAAPGLVRSVSGPCHRTAVAPATPVLGRSLLSLQGRRLSPPIPQVHWIKSREASASGGARETRRSLGLPNCSGRSWGASLCLGTRCNSKSARLGSLD